MKIKLLLFFALSVFICHSQNVSYSNIKKVVLETYPDIDMTNKLLAISIWNSQDVLSREDNKEFKRTCFVYEGAKLKGGLKGVVFISISSDVIKSNADIAITKDGLLENYVICDYKAFDSTGKLNKMGLNSSIKNIVFDTHGNQLFENIDNQQIFKSFNNLITR